jgi:hypothetical protein
MYRLHTLSDGNSNITTYFYDKQGYLDTTTYPGHGCPTPAYDRSSGTWSNVSGADSLRYPSFDNAGDISSNGRFLNRDPAVLAGGANRYSYCKKMPTTLQDHAGTFPIEIAIGTTLEEGGGGLDATSIGAQIV